MKFGYSLSNIGTIYMIECILYIYESNDYMVVTSNLDKYVYQVIAKKYRTNVSTFKSNIAKATDNMINIFYLKNPNNRKIKITPKVVIQEVLYKLANGRYI